MQMPLLKEAVQSSALEPVWCEFVIVSLNNIFITNNSISSTSVAVSRDYGHILHETAVDLRINIVLNF